MIFIDRLSFKSSQMVLRLIRSNKDYRLVKNVNVLDPIKYTFSSWIIKLWMRLYSIKVNETIFVAGDLFTNNGLNVWQEAKNISVDIDYKTSKRVITESKALSRLSEHWEKNKILLCIYKYFWLNHHIKHRTVKKILVADALSREYESNVNHLILSLPTCYNIDDFKHIDKKIKISFYPSREWSIKSTRLSVLLLIFYSYIKYILCIMLNSFKAESILGRKNDPAILLLQEEDISLDRSYRSQPHWLFMEDNLPKYRTIIVDNNNGSMKCNKMHKYNIYFVTYDKLHSYTFNHPLHKKISYSIKMLLRESLIYSDVPGHLLFELVQYFLLARLLTDFCVYENIKAFMTCENYLREANVMNLIGSELDVHTISYQYSNMDTVAPAMMSAADSICTFSPLFNERWGEKMFYNNEFVHIGYPYDASFKLLIDRAEETRKRIMQKGVNFIITYFDETVTDDKYGLTTKLDHFQVINSLMQMILEVKNFAIIIKTQFLINSPSVLYKDNANIKKVIKTGRWIELKQNQYANTRNILFPAEAALSSDMSIGHAEGGTSGLEAVLAGSRCILLNKHKFGGDNVKIFNQANILYNDMQSALDAIYKYHKDDLEYQNLGDWSSIVDQFDSHRDGGSAKRLRDFIEGILLPKA